MIRKANAACILATIFALSSTWAEDVTPEQARLEAEPELADETPVMVSLIAPVQAPYRSYDVTGFRLSLIYGECQDFVGFDLGVVNNTRGDFAGLAIGGVNIADDRMCGAQLGLVNWNGNDGTAPKRRSVGVQLGALNYADSFRGLQDGYLNVSTGSLLGMQYGFVNCANEIFGAQSGCYFLLGVNVVYGVMDGCQIGIVNYAHRVGKGCQIGLLNIIANNGWLPVLPILNGGF